MSLTGIFAAAISLLPLITIPLVIIPLILSAFKAARGGATRMPKKQDPQLSKARKLTAIIGAVLLLSGVVHLAAWGAYGYFQVDPEYKREVHGHVLNAYYANTPDLMLSELQQARQGMVNLGLEPGQYSTLKTWHQTPDNRMDYQYSIIDSVIERVRAVKEDRERQEAAGQSDQLGDVYETKMDNLRGFLKEEGWIDDIAKGAFVIEQHPYWAWWANWGGYTSPIFLIAGVVVPACAMFAGSTGLKVSLLAD